MGKELEEIEIEESFTDFEDYIIPQQKVTEIPLKRDRKLKIEKLCWAYNSTEEYANHFKEMVERGGISVAKAEEEASKLYALNATTYKRSQAVVSSSENGRVFRKLEEQSSINSRIFEM